MAETPGNKGTGTGKPADLKESAGKGAKPKGGKGGKPSGGSKSPGTKK